MEQSNDHSQQQSSSAASPLLYFVAATLALQTTAIIVGVILLWQNQSFDIARVNTQIAADARASVNIDEAQESVEDTAAVEERVGSGHDTDHAQNPTASSESSVKASAIALNKVEPAVTKEVTETKQTVTGDHAVATYKVQSGDNLSNIWRKIGAPHKGSLQAQSALKKVSAAAATLRVGESLHYKLNDHGDIVYFSRAVGSTKIVNLTGDSENGYTASVEEIPVVTKEKKLSAVLDGSLSFAALQAGVPQSVVDDFVDLFSDRVEFRKDIKRGDTFTIIYDQSTTVNGVDLDAGPIKSAALTRGGSLLAAVRHVGRDRKVRYYDQDGVAIGNHFLRYPVQFSRISSTFTEERFHPVLKIKRPHYGVDFSAPRGTPVRAVADGVITKAGYNRGAGNMVWIKHCSRWMTNYFHLNKITTSLRPGSRVTRGQVIGTVGSTGLSTGPHLHFGLFDKGKYVDPLKANLPQLSNTDLRLPKHVLQLALQTLEHERATILVAMRNGETRIG